MQKIFRQFLYLSFLHLKPDFRYSSLSITKDLSQMDMKLYVLLSIIFQRWTWIGRNSIAKDS